MHAIEFLEPCSELKPYIAFYAQRNAKLKATEIVHPMPARSLHVIEFLFRESYMVRHSATDRTYLAHPTVVVGLQTSRRVELLVRGDIDGFSIFFLGHALRQLLPVPVAGLTNAEYEAEAVLGNTLRPLRLELCECRSTQQRVTKADEFFRRLAARVEFDGAIVAAANAIRIQHGCCRMDTVARQTGLSPRHFERTFKEHVGVGPKLYARIVRFESALALRAAVEGLHWTAIAHRLGYHDQMHMIHDFRKLAGAAPEAFSQEMTAVLTPGREEAR